ncbi:hypothetical protein [Bacillus sp. REN10]|uniref:hypothetical protein n=1 Tax=Bacillus sp. REN10 TaxID=2782541 RepID=UPI00193AEB84|nr:hypothetical protein [Bacillus sp. REN10]
MREFEYAIPHEIVSLYRNKEDYIERIKSHFRLVHPDLKLKQVVGKTAVLVKQSG